MLGTQAHRRMWERAGASTLGHSVEWLDQTSPETYTTAGLLKFILLDFSGV